MAGCWYACAAHPINRPLLYGARACCRSPVRRHATPPAPPTAPTNRLQAPKGQPAVAAAGVERPAGDITTLAELQALPSFRLFAAPVACVRVTNQGEALAGLHASLFALRELRELDLRGNALAAVPPALGNLTALTRCAACVAWAARVHGPARGERAGARCRARRCLRPGSSRPRRRRPQPPQAVPGQQPAERAAG